MGSSSWLCRNLMVQEMKAKAVENPNVLIWGSETKPVGSWACPADGATEKKFGLRLIVDFWGARTPPYKRRPVGHLPTGENSDGYPQAPTALSTSGYPLSLVNNTIYQLLAQFFRCILLFARTLRLCNQSFTYTHEWRAMSLSE